MKRFLGSNRLRTAIFISGSGSNLKNLVKFSLSKNAPIKINLVISNNSKAKGLVFAKQKKLKTYLTRKCLKCLPLDRK